MPRFENEDFDPKKRSREDIDRTVPKDEDYYNYSPMDVDLNFNSKKRDDVVVDNQRKSSNYGNYQLDDKGDVTFKSETIDDFSRSGSHSKALRVILQSQTTADLIIILTTNPVKTKGTAVKMARKQRLFWQLFWCLFLL